MNAIALQKLWNYIQGLNLDEGSRNWLADHLREPDCETETPVSYTCAEMREILKERVSDIEKGNYVPVEDFLDEMQTWG